MKTCIFSAAFVGVLLCTSCCHTVARSSIPSLATYETMSLEELNRVASDPLAKHADKAAAVFALFKGHIKPGDNLSQVRQVLRNTAWVDEAKLYYFFIIGGYIPVDMNSEDRTYSLHLVADNEGYSEWVIYFQLAGRSEWGKSGEDGLAFLRGNVGSGGASRIKEFTLCYPDGRIERFNPKGRTETNIK